MRVAMLVWFSLVMGCAAPAAEPGVTAAVIGARPTGESVPATVVELRWTNPLSEAVAVDGYRIEWPGGGIGLTPTDFVLAPGATVTRTVRVDASAGDLTTLAPATAHVVLR